MARIIENVPSPDILMNSMRSIGYSFKTAMADIIDNSISANAKNIWIEVPINDENIFITILDDGHGMDRDQLLNAMRYGSDHIYKSDKDLGRFGLGLKSASLSQCKVLTVASKIDNEITAFRWDLDNVLKFKKWDCLELDKEEVDDIPNIESLKSLHNGTIVVWENFDIAFKKSDGHVRLYLNDEIEECETHLRLVFHRFMSDNLSPLKIFINDDLLKPIDPFLENNKKTDSRAPEEINVDGSTIKIQTFILPYQTDLNNDDIEKLGGIDFLKDGQGFYIYRNRRLIIYGTWFRLSSNNISSELYKYGRIKVDIPNTLDDMWDIDVKKQNATIPKSILNYLKKAVRNVCNKSKEKTSKRTKLTLNKDDSKIWNKKLSRDNKDLFFINSESEYIKNFLNEFDDAEKVKILRLLDVLSSSMPFQDIYNSICNKNNESELEKETLDSIIVEGVAQFKLIKNITQLSDEEVLKRVCLFEPFDNISIKEKLEEAVKNDK